MKGLSRYPEYRDSGEGWLGKIPAHWEMVELKRVAPAQPAAAAAVQHEELVWQLDLEHIAANTASILVKQRVPRSKIGGSTVWFDQSNVLYSKLRPYLNKVVKPEGPGCTTSELIPLSPRQDLLTRSYLTYYLLSPRFVAYASNYVSGTKGPRVIPKFFWSLSLLLPRLSEQRAIADFLDRKTSAIDRIVKKKERLMELLIEKRASLVSHTVTRGLDPDAPTRDSGVKWLGEIPAHWDVVRLKTVSNMRSGESITASSIEARGEYPVFGGNRLCGYTAAYTNEGEHLFIGRQGALCENVRLVHGRFWASEHTVVVSLCRSDDLRWLGAVLHALHPNQQSVDAAHAGLAIDRIRDLQIPLPPLPEQQAIADFLDCNIGRIEALAAKTREAVDLLREYRFSLISAAVTGQVDVTKLHSF